MVASDVSVIAPTSVRVTIDLMGKEQGSSELTGLGSYYVVLDTLTTTSFVEVLSGNFTIDTYGTINVLDIYLTSFWDNLVSGESKVQISGDGGTTWIDITDAIGVGTGTERTGPGLWISSIQTGTDKFRFRVLGRSTNGLSSNIRMRSDSLLQIVYNKTIL